MRKILITTGLVILWTLAVPIGFVAFYYFKKPPVERGDINSLETHLVKRLEQAEKDKQLGSAGIALIQEGKVVAEWGVGIGNYEDQSKVKPKETLYILASVSKVVTAWGIMKLVQDGKIELDTPIIKYLKRWHFKGSEKYGHLVTTRQLLSHTAGFIDGYGHKGFLLSEKLESLEESLLNGPSDAQMGNTHPAEVILEPGTQMVYSSAGYAVLQLLVEDVTGQSFDSYMKQQILKPLGMHQSSYNVDSLLSEGKTKYLAPNFDLELNPLPHRHYTNMAGVSLRTTTHDLAQLAASYHLENEVLSKETIRLMLSPQPKTDSTWGLGHRLYGFNNQGRFIAGHMGGTFPASGAEIRLNPATGNAIVILASGTQSFISGLAEDWQYWETGNKYFDIRNVIFGMWKQYLVVIVIGIFFIVWRQMKNKPGVKTPSLTI
jgi:CubicO group peptidase (beta-lactamase class C family)